MYIMYIYVLVHKCYSHINCSMPRISEYTLYIYILVVQAIPMVMEHINTSPVAHLGEHAWSHARHEPLCAMLAHVMKRDRHNRARLSQCAAASAARCSHPLAACAALTAARRTMRHCRCPRILGWWAKQSPWLSQRRRAQHPTRLQFLHRRR